MVLRVIETQKIATYGIKFVQYGENQTFSRRNDQHRKGSRTHPFWQE